MGKRKRSTFIRPNETVDVVFEDDDGHKNVVTIKARMDYGTRSKVSRDMISMSVDDMETAGLTAETVHISASPVLRELALLRHNIVRWRGPLFAHPSEPGKMVPATPEWIGRLDLDANRAWIEQVIEKILDLNADLLDEPTDAEMAEIADPETAPKD